MFDKEFHYECNLYQHVTPPVTLLLLPLLCIRAFNVSLILGLSLLLLLYPRWQIMLVVNLELILLLLLLLFPALKYIP